MGFDDNFHDITAIDKNNLIAYSYGSGLIVKSNNQGKTWEEVFKTDSIYFEQIEFPSPTVGFICGNTNRILKTEDGGNNWIEIKIDSIPESAPVYGMKFLNCEIGYLSYSEGTKKGFESKIYQTTNSGIEWKEINSIPEMILNIELVNNELWASGYNVIVKNIDKTGWQIVYKDTTKQVGQIRDFIINEDNIIMVSFNGYIICKKDNSITKKQITNNRLRSIISIDNRKIVVAGDNNKEKGNLFESSDNGKTWKLNNQDFNDIHRLEIKDGIIWGVGKNDLLIKRKL
jgi:photosystem II stability/assembly factor-like uncharacterized protein